MIDRTARQENGEGLGRAGGRTGLYVTQVILAIMGVALAIDAASVPVLSLLTVISIGGLIAALAIWG